MHGDDGSKLGDASVGGCPVKRSRRAAALSERELEERYAYLLGVLPDSVVDRAHAAVLEHASPAVRDEVLTLVDHPSPGRSGDADEVSPAAAIGAALRRDPSVREALAPALASAFMASGPVAAYFTVGVGSVSIDDQPLWVQEMVAHETAPIDANSVHHRIGHSGVEML